MLSIVHRWIARCWRMPTSRHVYYVLAVVNLAAIAALLLLSHWIFEISRDSADSYRLWTARQARYLELIQLALAVNAPGSEVFRTQNADDEMARLAAASAQHDLAVNAARSELQRSEPTPLIRGMRISLDEGAARVQQVERQSRAIVQLVEGRDLEGAARHLAAMDRWQADGIDRYLRLLHDARRGQEIGLKRNLATASWLGWLARTLAAGLSVLVMVVTWYGHRLARRLSSQQEALEKTQSTLVAQNARLTEQAGELRRAQSQAEEASRSKSAFLANMSHEIRTPMTAILGFAETLLSPDVSPDEQTLAVQTIRRNGDHLLEIINDILDLSKIEAGKLVVEHIPCSLVQLLADVTSLMRVRADAKGLALCVEYASEVPETMRTDPTRLRQVLINLIGNAIKFTDHGEVRIVVQIPDRDAPLLRIDVADKGIGMTPEQIANLFRPFTQADASTTRQFGGTGLGLSISKRLIEMLGGTIAVASRPGEGATFTITHPVAADDPVAWIQRPSEAISQPRKHAAAEGARLVLSCSVLLAEDGPDNQRLISFLLRKAGASVTIVENGQLAVEQACKATEAGVPFDVILMDMQMPVMDGYSAARSLRNRRYQGPIIALTAHAMAGDREKCLSAGCDDFVTKPVDRLQLVRTIDRYVAGPVRFAPASVCDTPAREA